MLPIMISNLRTMRRTASSRLAMPITRAANQIFLMAVEDPRDDADGVGREQDGQKGRVDGKWTGREEMTRKRGFRVRAT